MLAEKRFAEILRVVNEKQTVTVAELTELLGISESTVRRDLTVLNEMGRLRKVHGGAAAADSITITKDDAVIERQERNADEKQRIVQFAAECIQPNDFVFIDAGTTTAMLAEIAPANGASYVTNAVFHAKRLAQRGCKTYLLGGEFKFATEAVVGGEALLGLEKYNFTKGFFGTNGVHLKAGYSTPDIAEGLVKTKAMEHCKTCYVLSDPSKFGLISSSTFAGISDAVVVTTKVENAAFKALPNLVEVDQI